jgi:6-pyruvoyltetrahydropterin/6-carboxytetrahydropterin synthase
MSNIRITKQFSFETGHALMAMTVNKMYYKLSVTVIGITDRTNVNMVWLSILQI